MAVRVQPSGNIASFFLIYSISVECVRQRQFKLRSAFKICSNAPFGYVTPVDSGTIKHNKYLVLHLKRKQYIIIT